MRKEEYLDNSPETKEELFRELIGRVGIITGDGYPRVVPINFVNLNGYIYFHGSKKGEKAEAFKTNPKVTFEIDKPLSNIPSFWLGEKSACPATIYFKSLSMRGVGTIVSDLKEKADALNALMMKDQPEGGYHPITVDNPLYTKNLEETCVYRIEPVEVTVKTKLGQNRSAKIRKGIIKLLRERGTPLDLLTASEIEKTLSK